MSTKKTKSKKKLSKRDELIERYAMELQEKLGEGITYDQLMKAPTKDYRQFRKVILKNHGIDEVSEKVKQEAIIRAIKKEYLIKKLGEPRDLTLVPGLRAIAKQIGAPYSILMECLKSNYSWE